ncbi:transcriptional regulator ovo-like isoform X2 [Planococcus citri]|uniref:transcriptional regulator ovo-like isoform X2 n=1 Tax=Planococcus citri TaxID=170843 RepID=UPI0031F78E91
MPKIFLIKDRLQQQQLKLAETQALKQRADQVEASFPSSVTSLYEQPLSLIIPKNSDSNSSKDDYISKSSSLVEQQRHRDSIQKPVQHSILSTTTGSGADTDNGVGTSDEQTEDIIQRDTNKEKENALKYEKSAASSGVEDDNDVTAQSSSCDEMRNGSSGGGGAGRNSIISVAKPISEVSVKKITEDEPVREDKLASEVKIESSKCKVEIDLDENLKYVKGRKFLFCANLRTSAEKKEYPPVLKLDVVKEQSKEAPKPFRSQQVSVIQRTPLIPPSPVSSDEKCGLAVPAAAKATPPPAENAVEDHMSDEENLHQEPEQEAPIDYHIPKKNTDSDDEIKLKCILPSRRQPSILFVGRKYAKSTNILMAAAGHSRNSGGNNGGCAGGNSQNANGTSNGRNPANGHANYNGNGGVSLFNGGYDGAMGAGGDCGGDGSMNNGTNGKCGYENGGSPLGSLPPFYESLKGGHIPTYQHQICNQYQSLLSEQMGMDCDTGQDAVNLSSLFQTGGAELLPKQYSSLQNVCATYGITMKEEEDLSPYVKDNGAFLSYDDNLMIDAVTGSNVDPLQFTATLTFSTPTDNSQILDHLPESSDLFMREAVGSSQSGGLLSPGLSSLEIDSNTSMSLPSPTNCSLDGTGSMSPSPQNACASSTSPVDGLPLKVRVGVGVIPHRMESVSPHQQPPPSYSPFVNKISAKNASGALSAGLSLLEIDSSTDLSLPSPATSGASMDDTGSLSPSCVSSTSSNHGIPLKVRVGVGILPHNLNNVATSHSKPPLAKYSPLVNKISAKLGIPGDMAIEFVNGGHGIKNPLANQDTVPLIAKPEVERVPEQEPASNGKSRYSCRICSKSFNLQRLLNRHMKCHSDIKRYLCTFCGKGFNDTFDLKRHTRTHTGVRPYKCNLCEKSFTQRCSLESHCLKVHGVQHQYAYKERRTKMYVCEECGHTTNEPETHYIHLKEKHPYSPALLKFYDKRHFKFTNSNFANMLLQV